MITHSTEEAVTRETDKQEKESLSGFLPLDNPLMEMQEPLDSMATSSGSVAEEPKTAPHSYSWSIDLPLGELDRRQEEMLAELATSKVALKLAKQKRNELNLELKQIVLSSEAQLADVDARKSCLEADAARVAALAAATERCRVARSQLLAQKKKSHQDVLGTEICLRERQVTEPYYSSL